MLKSSLDKDLTLLSLPQDMTKADLYKRRNKGKQSSSDTSEAGASEQHDSDPVTIAITDHLNILKQRTHKSSLENDVELIKSQTQDTPVNEETEPTYNDMDEVPSVKPVEKTYGKSRSKLDDYMYVESSQALDDIDVYPKATRSKKSKDKEETQSPAAKKRRVETRQAKKEPARQLRKKADVKVNGTKKGRKNEKKEEEKPRQSIRVLKTRSEKSVETDKKGKSPKGKTEKAKVENGPSRTLRSSGGGDKPRTEKKTRPTKESIENEKKRTGKESIENEKVTRNTRKRKFEETVKPVLRETGQNGRQKSTDQRKVVRAKKTKPALEPLKLEVDTNVRMTRSRKRRMEISLSPSEVKAVIPAFSFESDARVNSIESNRSIKSNASKNKARNTKAKIVSKAKNSPKNVRATRSRANRR